MSRIDRPLTAAGPATSSDASHTGAQAGMQIVVPAALMPVRRPTGESILIRDPPVLAIQELHSLDAVSNDNSTNSSIAAHPRSVSQLLVEVAEGTSAPPSPGASNELPDTGSGLSIPGLPTSPPNDPDPPTVTRSLSTVFAATSLAVSSAEYESGVRSRSSSSASLTGTGVQTVSGNSIPVSLEQPPSAPQHPLDPSPSTTPLTGSTTGLSSSIGCLPESGVRRSLRLHPPVAASSSPSGAKAQTAPADSDHSPPRPAHQPPSAIRHPRDLAPPRTPHSGPRKRRASSTSRQRGRAVRPSLSAVSGATASGSISSTGYESGVRPYSPEVAGLGHLESEGGGGHHSCPTRSGDATPAASKKRPHAEISSSEWIAQTLPPFVIDKNWFTYTPVPTAIDRDGFYISPEAPRINSIDLREVLMRDLRTYLDSDYTDAIRLTNCFHSLLQQVLVQDPIMYLMAFAGMKIKNYRLISLPVGPLLFSKDHDSELMDTAFPFAKFLKNEREVPAITLLYSPRKTKIRIAPGSVTKEEVGDWWQRYGGDLKVAAMKLPLSEFLTAEVPPGNAITFPPQKPWYVEADPAADGSRMMYELKYISVGPEEDLDYSYWPEGTYDRVSRYNRDLVGPAVTGWGGHLDSPMRGRRFVTAMEVRGVWSIGDAILGLTSWDSPLVRHELVHLFASEEGEWYNQGFVDHIQLKLEKKVQTLLKDFELVYEETFGKYNEVTDSAGGD